MQSYQKLLLANKHWAAEQLELDENYFENLAADQKPEFLWIGCADSRVPADRVTGTQPGEMFVHRNVANLVINTDINLLSVLQYAVEVLKVKHVLVVGHYNCGGVKAAMTNKEYGLIDKWLVHIKEVYHKHYETIEAITDEKQKFDKMVELNVVEQVKNLAKTTIVQKAWATGQELNLHGWVLDLHTGLIKPVKEIDSGVAPEIHPIFKYDFESLKNQESLNKDLFKEE